MANKTINELSPGGITSPGDAFIFQSTGNVTYKALWSAVTERLFSSDIIAGTNISKEIVNDSAGTHLRLSASGGTNYTAGDGIDLTGGEISVKLGENLSLDPDTGAINASGDGTAATIQIGTVITGEPGTNASVTNSGTSSAAIFNFTIPRGNTGANGTNGNDGSDGYSVSAVTSAITGGHRVTIHSTDPEATDRSFDVMDGVTTIQATSLNIQLTLAAADWTGSTAPYTQTVTMSGMTSSIVPIIGLVPSSTVEAGIEQEKQWGYVTKAESGTDSITFSCYKTKPTVDLTVAVKVV